ncbi:MAG: DUF5320 domain-containing protein [Chloroflexi bacterium]|nr:DUF5320 domain-containing protein [Chloroflexota bacterium]
MPRGDGTGPSGQGPQTGRHAGYCSGYDRPGCANPGFGMGHGRGGGGRGWRNMYYATGLPGLARCDPAWSAPPAYGPAMSPMSGDQEVQMLKGQAEALKQQLDAISQRLSEIESQS